MSIFVRDYVTCSVCGHKQKVTYARSLFGAGSGELDGKPAIMLRRSMRVWVHKCRRCGYAARCLADGDRSLRWYLCSPAYVFCEGRPLGTILPMAFYQEGLLALRRNDPLCAYHAFLHAAWVCDDRCNLPGAFACRKKAAALFDRLEASAQKNEDLIVTQTDLLRRTGQFSRALQLLDKTVFENARAYADYERTLIAQRDRRAHSCREVERNKNA